MVSHAFPWLNLWIAIFCRTRQDLFLVISRPFSVKSLPTITGFLVAVSFKVRFESALTRGAFFRELRFPGVLPVPGGFVVVPPPPPPPPPVDGEQPAKSGPAEPSLFIR